MQNADPQRVGIFLCLQVTITHLEEEGELFGA